MADISDEDEKDEEARNLVDGPLLLKRCKEATERESPVSPDGVVAVSAGQNAQGVAANSGGYSRSNGCNLVSIVTGDCSCLQRRRPHTPERSLALPSDGVERSSSSTEAQAAFRRFSAPVVHTSGEALAATSDNPEQRRRATVAGTNDLGVPVRLDVREAKGQRKTSECVPVIAVRAVGNVVGLATFTACHTFGKLCTGNVSESPSFYFGCRALLAVNGVKPTILRETITGELSPLPEDDAEQMELLRSQPFMVSNHVSYMDSCILPLWLRFPRALAKSAIRGWPLFGRVGRDLDFIWVDRKSPESRNAAIEALESHAKEWKPGDRPILVFPEGSTSNGQSIAPFKKGAFTSGLPVMPVLIKYTGHWNPCNVNYLEEEADDRDCVEDNAEEDGSRLRKYTEGEWAMQFAGHMVHPCVILVCRPYHPSEEEKADPDLYAANVRDLMITRLNELHKACFEPEVDDMQDHLQTYRRRCSKLAQQQILYSGQAMSSFDRKLASSSVKVSEDGLYVRRKRNEQCGVVFGDAPVAFFGEARYFEVCVEKTCRGREGGLVLGVTTTRPESWQEKPEIGVDVPASYSLGYAGLACVHSSDLMASIPWDPSDLEDGDRVGLLITGNGEAWILENGRVMAKLPARVPLGVPLYGFVDLLGNTLAVSLIVGVKPVWVPAQPKANPQEREDSFSGSEEWDEPEYPMPDEQELEEEDRLEVLTAFDQKTTSEFVKISGDGQSIRHTDPPMFWGVVFGNAPIRRLSGGAAYFEVHIDEVVDDQDDGIVLGVTTKMPRSAVQLGDQVRASWSVGYDGSAYLFGKELMSTSWNPRWLKVGDIAGLLVTEDGDLVVFENHEEKVRLKAKIPVDRPLYAFVDLLGNTVAVTLILGRQPPVFPQKCG